MKIVNYNYAYKVINEVGNNISKVLGRKVELQVLEPYNIYKNNYALRINDALLKQDICKHKKEVKELCGNKILSFYFKNTSVILLRTLTDDEEEGALVLEFGEEE